MKKRDSQTKRSTVRTADKATVAAVGGVDTIPTTIEMPQLKLTLSAGPIS